MPGRIPGCIPGCIPDGIMAPIVWFYHPVTLCHNHTMSDSMTVFNRSVFRQHRERAASTIDEHDFLLREIGERLLERLDDTVRKFPVALDLGARTGLLGNMIAARGGVNKMFRCELSEHMARNPNHPDGSVCVGDEEVLPFTEACFDLVLSNLGLHWVNDLPGTLSQIRRTIKPDGLFMATMFGGDTLCELRAVLSDAEIALEGGLSPRVSPFADIRDIGALMQRAGFNLPVLDSETITVHYSDPMKLLFDLRGMGESNAVLNRRLTVMRRETLMYAMALYRENYAEPGDPQSPVPATFQVINLSGWAPAPDQQKPLRPGSAQQSMTEIF